MDSDRNSDFSRLKHISIKTCQPILIGYHITDTIHFSRRNKSLIKQCNFSLDIKIEIYCNDILLCFLLVIFLVCLQIFKCEIKFELLNYMFNFSRNVYAPINICFYHA